MHRRCLRYFLVITMLATPAIGSANDSVMGGSLANLAPMKSTDVSMESEDITITYSGHWEVQADYVFRNGSDKPLQLQLGFPEFRCDPRDGGDCVDAASYQFDKMKTEVRGKGLPMKLGKVSRDHRMGEYLGRAWVFEVSFAPQETVRVRHTYRVPGAEVIDGTQEIGYVTRTGAFWAGPIKKARFALRLPATTTWVQEPSEFPRKSMRFVQIDQRKLAELTYELVDWTPEGDFGVAFREGNRGWFISGEEDPAPQGPSHSGLAESERCENFATIVLLGEQLADQSPRRAPPSEADIQAGLSKGVNTRRICKNAVFAMYGRRFQDERLNKYFYGPQGFVPGAWPYDTFRPNPNYDQSMVTKGEWEGARAHRALARSAGAETVRQEVRRIGGMNGQFAKGPV